jgi:hypothetical protein
MSHFSSDVAWSLEAGLTFDGNDCKAHSSGTARTTAITPETSHWLKLQWAVWVHGDSVRRRLETQIWISTIPLVTDCYSLSFYPSYTLHAYPFLDISMLLSNPFPWQHRLGREWTHHQLNSTPNYTVTGTYKSNILSLVTTGLTK